MITTTMNSLYSYTISYNDGKLHASVEVAGEFSGWNMLPLTRSEENSTAYSKVIEGLRPGYTYMYKFIVDGQWLLANDGRPSTTDELGNANHVFGPGSVRSETFKVKSKVKPVMVGPKTAVVKTLVEMPTMLNFPQLTINAATATKPKAQTPNNISAVQKKKSLVSPGAETFSVLHKTSTESFETVETQVGDLSNIVVHACVSTSTSMSPFPTITPTTATTTKVPSPVKWFSEFLDWLMSFFSWLFDTRSPNSLTAVDSKHAKPVKQDRRTKYMA